MKRLLKQLVFKYIGQKELTSDPLNSHEKYKKSGLTEEEALAIRGKIKKAFEEDRIYRNNTICLDELSEHIQDNRYKVSQVINTYFSKNFYSFLNEYRIKEAKHLLVSDPTLSVKAVMYEVGFNSKNSFYGAFKKVTGLSPNDYRSVAATVDFNQNNMQMA
ncbi:helix-turn-helix domain-containing protein [Flagellimonas halotolerans]|uniref:Helix-turn-helix domain-containing protein n=1 Tax=Flagellimonas halotolerans TaxID=3112164 RepID=A0ABU6IND7_9FLAO|nr:MULTISPECIES: helix-turn-helix domain-containing protein [unclassified Allomuricauda]MEC3965010.1 helix-turn-helix domain-containing protein [Muricauda sp. SYSU M86414]MEC4264628.1 helix-turn-helix domain-containing protein [Muricauda sp. SYSU M84420]